MDASLECLSIAKCLLHVKKGWERAGLEPISSDCPMNLGIFETEPERINESHERVVRQRGRSVFNAISISQEGILEQEEDEVENVQLVNL